MKIIAPPHTPLDFRGELNLDVVQQQADHFCTSGVSGVFVGGSTGEGQSLTVEERLQLAERWVTVGKAVGLEVIIQVGHNCQRDSMRMAAQAVDIGADAVSSLAPCYFKPATADDLIDFLEPIAKAAGSLPFFFYDIPELTGVSISTIDFLRNAGSRLPNLAGVKFTNPDLVLFQECLRYDGGRYEIWFGCDEALLAGYALGARGAVGSTYNFSAPLYHQMVEAYDRGDIESARSLQAKSIELIRICQTYGFSSSAKAVMSLIGIDCGPVRSPWRNLSSTQVVELREKLECLGILAGVGRPSIIKNNSEYAAACNTPHQS